MTSAHHTLTTTPAFHATVSTFWSRWLIGGIVYTGLFGLLMWLWPAAVEPVFSVLYFGRPDAIATMDAAALPYARLLQGVLGSVLFGWSLAMLYWAMGPFRRGERTAWVALSWSVWGWFFTDTAYSLWSGFWQNALLNLGFVVLLGIPLLATRQSFKAGGKGV